MFLQLLPTDKSSVKLWEQHKAYDIINECFNTDEERYAEKKG